MNETPIGPVDYLIIEFPDQRVSAAGFAALLQRVENGSVYVIDIEFLRRDGDSVQTVPAHDLGTVEGIDFAELDGAATDLFDDDDRAFIRRAVTDGALAAVVVYEELSMVAVHQAFESSGARIVAQGPVALDDLDAALGD